MDYERGLERLKQLLRGTAYEQEFLVHELRLRENLRSERLYGTNEQIRSDRAQIIDQLNRLAQQVNTNFNDLCQQQSPSKEALIEALAMSPGTVIPRLSQKKQKLYSFYLVGIVTVLIGVSIGEFVFHIPPPFSKPIKPGGEWISPTEKTVGRFIHFAAYAYPTNNTDPMIDHVNFTIYWQGVDPRQWIIACVARKPVNKDMYECNADLHMLGVPARQQITMSFDIYDKQENYNNAPNGTHTLTYTP